MSDLLYGNNSSATSVTPASYLSSTEKTKVDIIPKIDISGRLFKLKNSNRKLKDTIVYNNFITRLNIAKDSIPGMPNMGLRDVLLDIKFTDESDIEDKVSNLENEIYRQMEKKCRVESEIDKENCTVNLIFHLEDMLSALSITYSKQDNGNVKIIDTQLI